MKKAILIAAMVLAVIPASLASAEVRPVNLLITGGNESNSLNVWLSADGRDYVIVSTVPLEVGGSICRHPEEIPTELRCEAGVIAGFEVNVGGGADAVNFPSDIPVPVTIRGGPGSDILVGGGRADKIVGGLGDDFLTGRFEDDLILGGAGNDRLVGGPGHDQLRGGPGKDKLMGGPGNNTLVQ